VQCGHGQGKVHEMRSRCGQRTEAADAVRTTGTNFLSAPSLLFTLRFLAFRRRPYKRTAGSGAKVSWIGLLDASQLYCMDDIGEKVVLLKERWLIHQLK